jgi:type IV pilus assembly protein PilQ
MGWALGLALLLLPAGAWAAKITSIDFKDEGGFSTIEIKGDGPLSYDKQENTEDKQLVLDLKGASLTKPASRILDTSSFNSRVTLVSPYTVDEDSRIVVQLREMAAADISQQGNTIRIKLPSPSGKADATAASDTPPEPDATPESTEKPKKSAKKAAAAAEVAEEAPAEDAAPPAEEEIQGAEEVTRVPPAEPKRVSHHANDLLGQFLEARETQHFIGRPITLQVRDADLVDVFRLIGEASGFNILIGDGVSGHITLSLTDVPWDQALDVILRTKRLAAERSNNLLRIVTLTSLTSEKQEELRAKLASESNAPRIVRIFPISYASLSDIQTLLTKFATSPQVVAATQAGAALPQGVAPIVSIDNRTNSLIVRDTPDNIERIRKLIEVLDTQTPQVLIEGKVVEAQETFLRGFHGGLTVAGQLLNGGQPGQNFGFGAANAPGLNFTLPPGGAGGGISLSPYTGFLPAASKVNATLTVAETENKIKIISSPRAVVLNKETASITQTTPIAVPVTTTTAGTTQSSINFVTATLSLNVQPTVTNDSGVLMTVSLSRDAPQGPGVSQRNIQTKVIVPSGSTLVLGGIYTAQSEHDEDGIPWIRKIPIIGALFGDDQVSSSRAELLFFLTPRILNSAAAGLTGGES